MRSQNLPHNDSSCSIKAMHAILVVTKSLGIKFKNAAQVCSFT